MSAVLAYVPLEKLPIRKPVDRISYIVQQCRGRTVLDLGCYDETALIKRETLYWLHGRIAEVAQTVKGLDNSVDIPVLGIETGPRSHILRGDVTNIDVLKRVAPNAEIIIAGELIEHLPCTLSFMKSIRDGYEGRQFIATTPNATSITNCLLGLNSRESCHIDHLQLYSYKTINSLCIRANFQEWNILPYYVRYTEMALRATGIKRSVIRGAEKVVNFGELLWPMLAAGLILHVKKI